MNPGKSPIFINNLGVNTNVPPAGNNPLWQLAQYPDVDQPQTALANRQQGNAWLETWRWQ